MISGINSATVGSAYANSSVENKDIKPNAKLTAAKGGSENKIEKLKESIDSGEYKIDLAALSQKMADELI